MPENGNKQIFVRKKDLITKLSAMTGKDTGLADKAARSVKKAVSICEKQMENRKYSYEEVEKLFLKQMKRTELKIAMNAVEKCFEPQSMNYHTHAVKPSTGGL